MKLKLIVLSLLSSSAFASINVDVTPYNSVCYAGSACQVGAVHNLKIYNDTPQAQTYHWFMAVQADNGDVVNKGGDVTLQPGQEFRRSNEKNIGYMKFNVPGRKMLHCTTRADGYEHNGVTKDGWADVQ